MDTEVYSNTGGQMSKSTPLGAVASGHWPLICYKPVIREPGGVPFTLDCLRPTLPLVEYRKHEGRFQALARVNTDEANRLMDIAQQAAHLRGSVYEKMAARSAAEFPADGRRGEMQEAALRPKGPSAHAVPPSRREGGR